MLLARPVVVEAASYPSTQVLPFLHSNESPAGGLGQHICSQAFAVRCGNMPTSSMEGERKCPTSSRPFKTLHTTPPLLPMGLGPNFNLQVKTTSMTEAEGVLESCFRGEVIRFLYVCFN